METPHIKKSKYIGKIMENSARIFLKKIATKYRAWQLQHGIYFDKFISNKIFTGRSYKYKHETHKHKLMCFSS